MDAAVAAGTLDPAAVVIDARRHAAAPGGAGGPDGVRGALRPGPAPTLTGYDELLRGSAT